MTSVLLASLLVAIPPGRNTSPPPQTSPQQSAQQLTDGEIRERIDIFLGTIDTPISPEQWRALGSRGAAVLEQMAQDPKLFPTRRAKAVAGLSAIGAPSSASVLLALARSTQAPLTVRLSAVHGAPEVVPPAQLETALKPVLEGAESPHVRAAAAEVLSRHGGCSLVRAQARREDDQLRLRRALQSCDQQ
jgi:hypothetical protein